MSVLDSTTDMEALFPTSPATAPMRRPTCGGGRSTIRPAPAGSGTAGTRIPVGICIASDIELDFDELDDGPNDTSDDDWEDRRKTAVHEVGHSIGLGHDTISTMRQGEIPDTSLTWRRYSADDIADINGHY